MIVDFYLKNVARPAGVAGPQIGLPQAYPVERDGRAVPAAVGLVLGVYEVAAIALDDAGLAAHVVRCAAVSRRVGLLYPDALADTKASFVSVR